MAGSGGGRRGEVIDLVRAVGRPVTAREIAQRIGLHPNTVRFHLDILERDGLLARQEGRGAGPGRPPARYVLVRGKDHTGVRNYQLLSEMLLAHLATADDPHTAAIDAGRQWGRYLVQPPVPGQSLSVAEAVSRLLDLLGDIGFDPAVASVDLPIDGGPPGDDPIDAAVAPPRTDIGSQIVLELRHCPFAELAATHRNLVCTMHYGLMSGALAALGAPIAPASLIPYATPTACTALLSTTPAATGTSGSATKGPLR